MTNKINKSELFKAMWKNIKEFAMTKSEALKKAWKDAKEAARKAAEPAKSFIEKAIEKGNRWTKGRFDRIYFDWEQLGLEVEYYNTGSISSATWKGEEISNAEASRIAACKVWINVEDECVYYKGFRSRVIDEDEIGRIVRNYVNA